MISSLLKDVPYSLEIVCVVVLISTLLLFFLPKSPSLDKMDDMTLRILNCNNEVPDSNETRKCIEKMMACMISDGKTIIL